jgi:hypothetical protein
MYVKVSEREERERAVKSQTNSPAKTNSPSVVAGMIAK